MARKLRLQYAGAIYHVTFRGNARQAIFLDDSDRQRLTARVAEGVEDFGVRVYLYCWMRNHGHMVIETPRANLSAFMGSVLTGYTVYFNLRHRRIGHLMQGRFKSPVVSGDEYLLRLTRYIHLNPVMVKPWKHKPRRERIGHLRGYPWSSYRGYVGLGPAEPWVCREPMWALVPGRAKPRGYQRYVEESLKRPDEVFRQHMEGAVLAIGPEEFRQRMIREHEGLIGRRGKREDVSLRHVRPAERASEVVSEVCATLGVEVSEVRRKRRDGTARGLVALAVLRRCALSERAVSEVLGLGSGSAVSYLTRRIKQRMTNDPDLALLAERLTRCKTVNSHFQG